MLFLLNSCQSAREGFMGQKKNNSDEFLVEKKDPLVLPPDFDDLPEPKNSKSITPNLLRRIMDILWRFHIAGLL